MPSGRFSFGRIDRSQNLMVGEALKFLFIPNETDKTEKQNNSKTPLAYTIRRQTNSHKQNDKVGHKRKQHNKRRSQKTHTQTHTAER